MCDNIQDSLTINNLTAIIVTAVLDLDTDTAKYYFFFNWTKVKKLKAYLVVNKRKIIVCK